MTHTLPHTLRALLLTTLLLGAATASAQDKPLALTPAERLERHTLAELSERKREYNKAALRYEQLLVTTSPKDMELFRRFAMRATNAWLLAGEPDKADLIARYALKHADRQSMIHYTLPTLLAQGYHDGPKPDPTKAAEWAALLIKAHKGQLPGIYISIYPAQCAFILAEQQRERWLGLAYHIKTQDDLIKAEAARQAQLDATIKAYEDVIKYLDDEWRWAAAFRIGQVYEVDAYRMLALINKANMTDEMRETYKNRQRKSIESAMSNYEDLLKRAAEAKKENEWILLARDHLSLIKPTL